jgi:predicted RNA-binding protein YlqC (UPF0109 family)
VVDELAGIHLETLIAGVLRKIVDEPDRVSIQAEPCEGKTIFVVTLAPVDKAFLKEEIRCLQMLRKTVAALALKYREPISIELA